MKAPGSLVVIYETAELEREIALAAGAPATFIVTFRSSALGMRPVVAAAAATGEQVSKKVEHTTLELGRTFQANILLCAFTLLASGAEFLMPHMGA